MTVDHEHTPDRDREDVLLRRAGGNRARSHAPYSKFRAGATVFGDDGELYDGVIVENVSLGLAMCAERVAMFSAVAAGTSPSALALVAPPTDDDVTWPCGACLQTALELGGPDLPVVVAAADGDGFDADSVQRARVGDLLPRGPYVAH